MMEKRKRKKCFKVRVRQERETDGNKFHGCNYSNYIHPIIKQ